MLWRPAAAAVVAVLAFPASPAHASYRCPEPITPGQVAKGIPVEDQMYAPKSLAWLATGAGVRVAVIDSGVDPDHRQLRGQVAPGRDLLHGNPDAQQDCHGHGTGVASIIAARSSTDTGFQGLAPDATIVPVRVSEEIDTDGKPTGPHVSFHDFARAIDWAVQHGNVQVINLSVVTGVDDGQVRDAVRRAIEAGVVVVAAAGNDGERGNPDPYPAKYDGVIGVGAITQGGVKAAYSQHGSYVDLVALGDGVTVAARGGGHSLGSGTSFATPFVAATAALIKQRFPDATPAEVERRLEATADPSPAGGRSDDYGYGLLNPYRALTETLDQRSAAPAAPQTMRTADPARQAMDARRARSRGSALLIAAIGGGAVPLIALTAIVVRRGQRRGWRPAVAGDPPDPARPESRGPQIGSTAR